MTLNGADLKRIRDAFVTAYDVASLKELLRFKLNRRLDTIAPGNANFQTAVLEVLEQAERDGWLRELIEKAVEDRSGNAAFVAVCQSLLGQSSSEQEGDTRPGPEPGYTSPQQNAIRPEELRRVMTEQLNRADINILWFDLFGTTLDNDLPGCSVQECVIELIARARQRHKSDALVETVREAYPHVLAGMSPVQDSAGSSSAAAAVDEDSLVAFLEGLTPSDFARILVRLPGTANQVSDNATHLERVAALIRYVCSSGGPGLHRIVQVIKGLFPNAPPFG